MARSSTSKRGSSRTSSAKRPAGRAARRRHTGKRKPDPKVKGGHFWLRWSLLILILTTLASSLYVLYLDWTVKTRFDGRRWALPAHVYARPMELFSGAPLDAGQLVAELKRLGYRPVKYPRSAGTYSRNRDRFLVYTRGFDFPDGREPGRHLELQISKGKLGSLKDFQSGVKLALIRLEAPLIGRFYPARREDRILVQRRELPEQLVQALLNVEDRDFYQHHGVDLKGIARAAWANLRAGRIVQGGSTLTQQLVKNVYLDRQRSLGRKANEALMSLLLERRYGKDEILEAYANEIYLGQDGGRAVHGFGMASEFYFGRPLGELDLPKLALLVALVRGPSYYDPRRHPQRARQRRDLVLGLLAERGLISDAEKRAAARAPLGVTGKPPRHRGAYPAFLQLVRRQLHRDYREQDLTSEGLRIFTTMDPWVQETAEKELVTQLEGFEKRLRLPNRKLQGAVVIASRDNGEVLAVIGGRDPGYAGFNRALDAVRPIGSLIKPVVYLAALTRPHEYTLLSKLKDSRLRIQGPDGEIWQPRNYDRESHGAVFLRTALAQSYNLATVRLGMALGLNEVSRLLDELGASRPVKAYPSLLLGAAALTPLEVTQVYQTLAAGGFYSPLRAIHGVTDAGGKALQRYPLTVDRVAPPGPVYLLNRVLQEVVVNGTGRSLRSLTGAHLQVAGKTGTTDDLRDSWFAGFTGDKVGVVWVGRDDNEPASLTGATGAMRVWGEIFDRIRPMPLELLPPVSVQPVWIDPDNGLRADAGCPRAMRVPFIKGSAPKGESPCRADIANLFERFTQ